MKDQIKNSDTKSKKRKHDDGSTREKILKAARTLFVKHGFSGTSMGKIAKLAQVNHSLLFHHFGNKEKLWLEVKQSIARDSRNHSKMLPELLESFPEFLIALIKKSIAFYRENPDIIRMLNWQRLEFGSDQDIGVTLSPESQEWLNAFAHYQNNGDIDKSLKPEFIITYILSIVSVAALDPNVFINDMKKLNDYIEFCAKQLLKSLKK